MIKFGSDAAKAVLRRDKSVIQEIEEPETSCNEEVTAVTGFASDIEDSLAENASEFEDSLSYWRKGYSLIAVCPTCESVRMICAGHDRAVKDSALNIIWYVVDGCDIRQLPDEEAKKMFKEGYNVGCECSENKN